MDFWMFLFFDAMFFTLGLVVGRWFFHRGVHDRATCEICQALESRRNARRAQEQPEPEPGTLGKRPSYSAIALLDQMDALLASRATEAQLDADIEEMQRRGW